MPRVPKIQKESLIEVSVPDPTPVVAPRQNRSWAAAFVFATLFLLSLGVAGYFYYQYRQAAVVQNIEETEALVTTIGRMMELPEGEVPTLATVTDKEKLSAQAFFQKSENGDKVLIYSQSGKAVLYRPSTGKIVDVTTVNVAPPETQAPTETPEPTPEAAMDAAPVSVSVTVLNGSQVAGLTTQIEGTLKPLFPNVTVVTKANARKRDYAETLVIDVTGRNSALVRDIAAALEGSVSAGLPEGETASPDSEILIIASGSGA